MNLYSAHELIAEKLNSSEEFQAKKYRVEVKSSGHSFAFGFIDGSSEDENNTIPDLSLDQLFALDQFIVFDPASSAPEAT